MTDPTTMASRSRFKVACDTDGFAKPVRKSVNKADRKKRFDILSQLGCCVCGQPPQIHHLIGAKYRGMGQKADDLLTIPLCMNHHTGAEGIHTIGKKTWESKFETQEHYLELTNQKVREFESNESIW